jgi:hypothetical protein
VVVSARIVGEGGKAERRGIEQVVVMNVPIPSLLVVDLKELEVSVGLTI